MFKAFRIDKCRKNIVSKLIFIHLGFVWVKTILWKFCNPLEVINIHLHASSVPENNSPYNPMVYENGKNYYLSLYPLIWKYSNSKICRYTKHFWNTTKYFLPRRHFYFQRNKFFILHTILQIGTTVFAE